MVSSTKRSQSICHTRSPHGNRKERDSRLRNAPRFLIARRTAEHSGVTCFRSPDLFRAVLQTRPHLCLRHVKNSHCIENTQSLYLFYLVQPVFCVRYELFEPPSRKSASNNQREGPRIYLRVSPMRAKGDSILSRE